ncbi:hypothetical protein [Marinobacter salarius]|uniref:hypothetical protein n=1 Tax=Marinobacter salarius TaxID=1420917 RepID=UPI003D097036
MRYQKRLFKIMLVLIAVASSGSVLAKKPDGTTIWVNSDLTQEEVVSGLSGADLTKDEMLGSDTAKMFSDSSRDTCRAVLQHAVNVYATEFSVDEKKAWAYAKACGSSGSSQNLAIDIVIEEMPIGMSGGSESREKWCNENSSYQNNYRAAQKVENRVFATAIVNWRQCMQAKEKNLVTEVNVSTTDTVFNFNVTNRTPHNEDITSVNIISDLGEGITCDQEPTKNQPIEIGPSQTKSILCWREFVSVERKGQKFEVLPSGTITFSNTLSPFFYTFNEQFKNEATPEPDIPRKIAMPLTGQHIGTKGYWQGGARHKLLYCKNRIDVPPSGYELVEVTSRREERVVSMAKPRGRCGASPFCDSAGEFCNEVYFGVACNINKEWHDWYKSWAAENGVAYSEESVCRI